MHGCQVQAAKPRGHLLILIFVLRFLYRAPIEPHQSVVSLFLRPLLGMKGGRRTDKANKAKPNVAGSSKRSNAGRSAKARVSSPPPDSHAEPPSAQAQAGAAGSTPPAPVTRRGAAASALRPPTTAPTASPP